MGHPWLTKNTINAFIYDPRYQTDVPHLLDFALRDSTEHKVNDPKCRTWKLPECKTQQFYGIWRPDVPYFDKKKYCSSYKQKISEIKENTEASPLRDKLLKMYQTCPYDDIVIESLMLCAKPHWFSSGAHRVMFVLWYHGERYVLAVEEGKTWDNLFIQALTPWGKERLEYNKLYAVEVLKAAIKETTGATLYTSNFDITVYDDTQNLLGEGCAPSPEINQF